MRYLDGLAVDEILAQTDASGDTSWYLTDQLGSVVAIASTSAVLDQIVYDPFGNIVTQTNATDAVRFGFAGMEYDSVTGLYYDHARYYDAVIGRFVSQDPKGFAAGDADLYRYVGNEPTVADDPSGEQEPQPWPIGPPQPTYPSGGVGGTQPPVIGPLPWPTGQPSYGYPSGGVGGARPPVFGPWNPNPMLPHSPTAPYQIPHILQPVNPSSPFAPYYPGAFDPPASGLGSWIGNPLRNPFGIPLSGGGNIQFRPTGTLTPHPPFWNHPGGIITIEY
jgi:RHS repeat-associated protein